MNPKVNFMLVGLFVIGLCVATIFFVIWLSFGYGEEAQKFYLIYMKESVAGLNQDSAVKFNGVNVGTIKAVQINAKDPSEVIIKIQVKADTPVTVDTRATLMSQGLTGLSYINLSGGDVNSALLKPTKGEQYAVIHTNPSLLLRIDATISKLTKSMTKISDAVDYLLRSENQKQISAILKNISDLTGSITQRRESIAASFSGADYTFQTLNSQTLPALNESLSSLQGTTSDLTNLVQEVSANPNILLTGKQPLKPGPGEK